MALQPPFLNDANLTFTDITTNNAATTQHGLLKKLDNTSTHFMNGAGSWAIPSGTGSVGDVLSHLYVKADYGAVGDGTTNDTTAINNAIAAVAAHRGQELIFEPGVYLVPGGITETKPGLVVRGIGHRSGGPGQWGDNGVVIKSTTTGAWCWTHDSATGGNDYDGGRFENLTFKGDSDTAGGLRVRKGFVVVMNCGSCLHTTGIGFLVQLAHSTDTDASWNILQNCLSQDDLVGFQCGTAADVAVTPAGATSTEFHNCINIKTGGGGIQNTGTGVIIWDNASSVFGGKFENNDIGINVKTVDASFGGAQIFGARVEANASYDITLNRPSGTGSTRNLVVCRANNVLVGAFQINDTLVVGPSSFGSITDNGTDTIIVGNGVLKTTRTAGTPSGGFSGEIRVGSGKIWVNDNGTWKSATVT